MRAAAILLAFAATGCGIGFKITDGDDQLDREIKGPEVAQAPKALEVTPAGQLAIGNDVYARDVGTLTAQFDYTPDADRTLRLNVMDFKRKQCGDPNSVVPAFTWREVDANGASVAGTEKDIPAQSTVTAVKGKVYKLDVAVSTSFGSCGELLVRFEMRDVSP